MPHHPLDRPVWSALTSGWSHLAQGSPGRALRLREDYGPFCAPHDLTDLSTLTDLDPGQGDGMWLMELAAHDAPPGLTVIGQGEGVQMVAENFDTPTPDFETVELADSDGPEMLALALLTKPGPFARATHRLSQFLGVKVDGRIVAMAGERMRMPGWAEISGVCTHPDYRGKGYAAGLMRLVGARIKARGETPFLHAYASNHGAIRLYESMGFVHRTKVVVTAFKRV